MRSELVFGAAAHVTNRYLLTSIAAKATRALHRPNSRLEDTQNDVFRLFGHANRIADGSLLRPALQPLHDNSPHP